MTDLALSLIPDLLATAAAPAPAGGEGAGGATPVTGLPAFLITQAPLFLLFAAIFYFLIFMPQRRQRQEKQALMESLAKGATVRMNGGEIGKIVRVEDDTITLKVDESNNVKIRYAKDAVLAVIDAKPKSIDETTENDDADDK